jgi:uncharacterized protein
MRSAPRSADRAAQGTPRTRAVLVALALLAAVPSLAAVEVPFLSGRVNDTARMLSDEQRQRVEAILAELEQATGAQGAILTIDTLDGEAIEDFSLRVAETWKLGQKGKDNGVLVLVARDDRKMRIEVGYGLEGALTDALSSRILDEVMRPRFRAGDFGGGIEAGTNAIARTIRGEQALPAEAPTGQSFADAPWWGRAFGLGMFVLVVGIFSVVAVFGPGCQSWFLYVFLMPFYLAFPAALVAPWFGAVMLALWLVTFPVLKLWLGRSTAGRAFLKRHPGWAKIGTSSGGSGRSSSGGFSGGGGSFGGGGASGSW